MIIDTHVHFGDPSRPNPNLYRTEMPEVYKAVAVPEGITGTVFMETKSGVEEVEWVLGLAADDPFFVGLVGDISPYDDDFDRHIERFAPNPVLSGIRVHGLDYGGAERFSRFMKSMELLVSRDLELDIDIRYDKFDALFEITRRLPELRVVINHIGEARPISGVKADPRWSERMHAAAQFSRVYCKVSALVQMPGLQPAPTDVEFYRPTLDVLWDAFGEDRLIYGSNWPQIEAVSDFATAQRIVASYFEGKGGEAVEKFFWKNARAAYRYVER